MEPAPGLILRRTRNACLEGSSSAHAQPVHEAPTMNDPMRLSAQIDAAAAALEAKVIGWRRDFHRHPELSNREVRTAGVVAAHLRSLGLTVQTGIAHTGVVALLDSGKPGPVIALRADM